MGIQVDLLTQDKTQLQDYINFQFDGKYVSDFGLVVVTDGDRLSFDGSAEFEDEVSSVNGVNGQYYWGTNFKSLKREFTLATDGMTEAQVQAFKYHFRPGRYGKFVESQYSFRESYCRVASVTKFSVIPFKKLVTTSYKDANSNIQKNTTYVNEYKGEVKLTLEWDYPYSTSIRQYFNDEDYTTVKDFNAIYPAIFTNNIPLSTSLAARFMAGNSSMLGLGVLGELILGSDGKLCDFHLGTDKKLRYEGAAEDGTDRSYLVSDDDYSADIGAEHLKAIKIFYNPSTAPTPAIITFSFNPTVTPIKAEWEPVYFNDIADKYNTLNDIQYNTIQISEQITASNNIFSEEETEGNIAKQFFFSSPNVISSIHRAIEIAYKYYKNGGNALQLEEELRQELTHDAVLKWAISVLAEIRIKKSGENYIFCDNNDNFLTGTVDIAAAKLKNTLGYTSAQNIKANWFAYFNILMLYFFSMGKESSNNNLAAEEGWLPLSKIKIIFDSENNDSTITYSHMYNSGTTTPILNKINDREEKCGDMAYSAYLKLDGGDTINEYGQIVSCHFLKFKKGSAFIDKLDNIQLQYKYTYL